MLNYSEWLIYSKIHLILLSFFDSSELLFNQSGWRPIVVDKYSNIMFSPPLYLIGPHRRQHQEKYAKHLVSGIVLS
ncbi:MAG: hypothetical protein O4805_05535 [Trichodesmium sp. St16_bin2-tuft]|nr:hypothetical protein [Trichodesmium sp. St16_bin2-tuft]MDE5122937.1 hypothetical protein [Trichodesmium sp. St19_bin1]